MLDADDTDDTLSRLIAWQEDVILGAAADTDS